MGGPDPGTKAPTPVGNSHGTGVSTGGPVPVVTGVIPRVTLGVAVLWWSHSGRAVGIGQEVARQDGRRAGPRRQPRGTELGGELPSDEDWCS